MKSYDIFAHQNGRKIRVKRGFSWPAFLIGPLWAAFKRAWAVFFLMASAYVALLAFDLLYVADSTNVWLVLFLLTLYIAYMVLCGVYGNRWLAGTLSRKGYVRVPDLQA